MLENGALSEIQNGLSLVLANSFLCKECLEGLLENFLSLLKSKIALFERVHNVEERISQSTDCVLVSYFGFTFHEHQSLQAVFSDDVAFGLLPSLLEL